MEFERIADKKRSEFITNAISKNIPIHGQILDVGCGNGIISRAVGSLGYTVTGIDSSTKTIEAANDANKLPNVNFMVVAAGNFTPERGKYAAIICSEVLEHLHTPGDLLTVLRESLSDDGILIVTVPNGRGPRELFVTRPIQYLQRKNNFAWKVVSGVKQMLGYKGTTVQSSADDLTHIQFFTYAKLRQLASENGFRIAELKKGNFIEQVFPLSLIFKRSVLLQRFDSKLADLLPKAFTSGFMTVWRKM
ncbi:MAG: methyltransferase domain-containing protein [Chitinophagaceae bacterium]|nr:MAG: methyltransferase domain-containing protein [Chitinophagaceae bacterium]